MQIPVREGAFAVGYNRTNTSPILKLFLSRLDELTGHAQT
jgi:hypothetical protein